MGLAWVAFLLAATVTPTAEFRAVEKKMASIEKRQAPANSTVTFTEQELSAWARVKADEAAPGALRDPKVALRNQEAVGSGLVDFVKLRKAQGGEPPGMLFSWLLSGERPVSVTVRIDSGNGEARVDVLRVQVSGFNIEGSALDFLIKNFVLPNYPEATIGEPFALKHRMQKIEVASGRVLVRIGDK
jgi:hypothetical protein